MRISYLQLFIIFCLLLLFLSDLPKLASRIKHKINSYKKNK
uniref:Uncharacterized protein n=1 Tax=Akkesiphycus lubricus TaxID=3022 RepID=A0A8F0FD13_AKKLU|nr:hypothetical protein [Akkesiphycus lubricus]